MNPGDLEGRSRHMVVTRHTSHAMCMQECEDVRMSIRLLAPRAKFGTT